MASKAPKQPVFKTFLKATHSIVSQITRGPDGRMWFTEQFSDSIGAITNAGVVTHDPTGVKTAISRPRSSSGRTRNNWYTLYSSAGKVGRMTVGGAHTEHEDGRGPVNSLVGVGARVVGKSLWVGGEFSQLWRLDTSRRRPSMHIQPR